MQASEHNAPNDPHDIHFDPKMKLRSCQKPSRCPWCGSSKIALMLNGMPVFFPDLAHALDDGGGLVMGGGSGEADGPAWQCTECYAQFFRDSRDAR